MLDLAEFAEQEGSYGTCPNCSRRTWTESGTLTECHHCGYPNQPEGDTDNAESD